MAKITNLQQLSKDLLEVYSLLREGSIEAKTAEGLANVAGKVIVATKVILDYNSIKNNIDKIELLEDKKGKTELKQAV